MAKLTELAAELGAETIVVGLPITLSGGESDQTREAVRFADALRARVEVPVEMFDERFTTTIASRSGGTETSEDSRAAAVLLEDWLARHG